MKWKYLIPLAGMGFVALLSSALAASAPSFGAAARFAVLGGSGAVSCTDASIVGDVGVYPGTVITPVRCTIFGTLHPGDAVAQAAHAAFLAAYARVALEPCTGALETAYTNAAVTLAPGVYCNSAAVTFTDTTLTLAGPPNAVWIFKIGTLGTGALTGTRLTVLMPDGKTCDNNVFWWTAQAATLTDSAFLGSILAGTSITATRDAGVGSVAGKAFAKVAVTLTGPGISVCGSGGTPPGCDDDDDDHHGDDHHGDDHHDDDHHGDDHHGDDHHGDRRGR